MDSASAKPLEQMLSRCRESRFTGEVRVRTEEGEGLIRFLSGTVEGTQFDSLDGDAAIDRILSAGALRFEARRELPPIAGYEEPLPAEGRLGVFSPVDLMRYCEEQALSCVLEMRAVGKVVRATYEVGELLSLQPEADMTMSMLEAREGSYQVVLPQVDPVLPAPTRVPVTAPPRPVRGAAPTHPVLAPASRPALPDLSKVDSASVGDAPVSGASTLRPYGESDASNTSPFDPQHFLATLKPPEDAPAPTNAGGRPGAARGEVSLPGGAALKPSLPAPLPRAEAAGSPEPPAVNPMGSGPELEMAAGRAAEVAAAPLAPSAGEVAPPEPRADELAGPPPSPRRAAGSAATPSPRPPRAFSARAAAPSVPPPELDQLLDRARQAQPGAPAPLPDSLPPQAPAMAPLQGFGPLPGDDADPPELPPPWAAPGKAAPKLPSVAPPSSGAGIWVLAGLVFVAAAAALWFAR